MTWNTKSRSSTAVWKTQSSWPKAILCKRRYS